MKTLVSVLAAVLLLAGGCGKTDRPKKPKAAKSAKIIRSAQAEPLAKPFYQGNFLEDRQALAAAQGSLKTLPQFAGKDIRVYEHILFFGGVRPRIELAVQNPDRPAEADYYIYENGQWAASGEAETPAGIQSTARTFLLDGIRFESAADIAAAWKQQAKAVGAVVSEPYHVAFRQLPPQRKRPAKRFWSVPMLEAVGAQYYLSFNEDGSRWEFKKQ